MDLHFSFRVSMSPKRLSWMALAIGSIMAVVAVLLSHMDRKDEVSIIPRMSLEKTIQSTYSLVIPNLITALSPKCKGNGFFSPCRFHADNTQDLQGYSAMQAPLLNRWGHQKAAKEEKIGFKKVLRAYFFGWKNSQCWEKAHWKYSSDSQGKRLCAPKNSHQQDHIKTFSFLKEKVLGNNGTGLTTTVLWKHQWYNIDFSK